MFKVSDRVSYGGRNGTIVKIFKNTSIVSFDYYVKYRKLVLPNKELKKITQHKKLLGNKLWRT